MYMIQETSLTASGHVKKLWQVDHVIITWIGERGLFRDCRKCEPVLALTSLYIAGRSQYITANRASFRNFLPCSVGHQQQATIAT